MAKKKAEADAGKAGMPVAEPPRTNGRAFNEQAVWTEISLVLERHGAAMRAGLSIDPVLEALIPSLRDRIDVRYEIAPKGSKAVEHRKE